jgi:hypothetical protein
MIFDPTINHTLGDECQPLPLWCSCHDITEILLKVALHTNNFNTIKAFIVFLHLTAKLIFLHLTIVANKCEAPCRVWRSVTAPESINLHSSAIKFLKQKGKSWIAQLVKPVYKGHSKEPENVAFMSNCPLYAV